MVNIIGCEYDIYLASPLFSETDNKILDLVEDKLSSLGLKVFSPRHESQFNLSEVTDKYELDECAKKVMEANHRAIESSAMVLANTKGIRWDNALYFDGGTAYEIGYAVGIKKPVITFNVEDYGLNIMLSQSVVTHLQHLNDDIDKLNVIVDVMNDLGQFMIFDYNTLPYDHSYVMELLRNKYYNVLSEQV